MIPAVLVLLGIAYLGIKVGNASRPTTNVGAVAAYPDSPKHKVSYRALLVSVMREGRPPSKFLIGEALREAMKAKDWGTVATITKLFRPTPTPQEQPAAPQEQDNVPAPQEQRKSPLEGVSDEEWAAFVDSMRTKDAAFRTNRLVGAWEHNLGRLRQLDISEPTTEEDQYAAFAKDMQTYAESEAKLLNDYSGEVVAIDGQPQAVTPSGILGLLKAAGSEGAKSWLTNEADRKRFPNTTQAFLRANGAF